MIAPPGNSSLMKTKATFAVVTLAVISAFSSLAAAEAELPYYGWRLKDLEPLIKKAPSQAVVIMVGEPVKFHANINIMIQPFPGTMKDYMDLSRGEFQKLFEKKWKVLWEKQNGENEWICESTGTKGGEAYQFYSRAVKDEARIFLITATALQTQWGSLGEKMRRQVDSFKTD